MSSSEGKDPPRKANLGGCGAMSMVGNLAVNWKRWFQSFKLYLKATCLEEENDSRKVAIFLHMIGEKGLEIFNTFEKDEEKITYKELVQLFENNFVPKENLTYESYKFFTYKQSESETLEEFICNLRTLSQACKFGNIQDRMIKVMFICHLHSRYSYLQEKLLIEDDSLTSDKALELAKTISRSRAQAESLQGSQVNYIQGRQTRSSSQARSNSQFRSRNRSASSHSFTRNQSGPSVCNKCGQVHRVRCPALNARCRKCNKVGHFEKLCRSKSVRFIQTEEDTLFVGSVTSNSKSTNDWTVDFTIQNKNIKCLLDTGSDINIMPKSVYDQIITNVPLRPCQIKVKSYTNDPVKVLGSQNILCKYEVNNTIMSKVINFVIADVNSYSVIGKHTCMELGLVKRVYMVESNNKSDVKSKQQSSKLVINQSVGQSIESENKMLQSSHTHSNESQSKNIDNILSNYKLIFSGLGCLPGECHITTDSKVQPKVDAPRKVPFALHDKLKTELQKMENMDVIVKVTEPTAWVSSLLLVEKKNGQLRVCLDPRNLNQAIQRTHYPINSVDSVRSKVAGAKYYSTLDASSGFWMICLDEESSFLTTFNTPFGRYRFKRLPYGVNCAPEFFHRVMTETFGDIPGVSVYSDDILVSGNTLEEHNERLIQVFERAKDSNVKFNRQKCSFACPAVKYLGHIFSGDGISADPDKIRAIQEMPSPTCMKDLQRFLGMLNYLSPFINNLATEVAPLRELLKKNSTFVWNSNYENVFKHLKSIICSAPVLAHFDVHESIKLSVDASSTAVGAVLLQKEHPVYYISKTLTESQQRMAQIEKELYAIVFACVRFHQFIYGQVVTVETDHRPLITLFKKPLVEVPTRLQRMMMKIQAYHLNVIYRKGTEMFIADTLSRAALSETGTDELDEDIIVHVNLLMKSLPVSPERLEWLKNATTADESMKVLKKYCKDGWPSCKNKVEDEVKPYWYYRHEIHTEQDLVFKGNAIVIPTKIRPDMMKIIHSGHLGTERSKAFARGSVFWPFMSSDIKNTVESCPTCLTHKNSNPPEPLKPHELTTLPWEKVGVDFLDFKGQKYLVIEDYYSNYIEVISLTSTNAKSVILALKSVFSRHGIPVEIFSDNGPPFNSIEFKTFIFDWGIQHNTSSPYLPRSNGLVESGVKICKRIFSKCDQSGSDPHLALLQYRNTPRGNIASPAQLLMSRSLRTQLPVVTENLQPKIVHFKNLNKLKEEKNEKMKKYYDRKARNLEEIEEGEKVYYKKSPDSPWTPGKIISKCQEPRSYILESPDGFIGRRNRQHIMKTPYLNRDLLAGNGNNKVCTSGSPRQAGITPYPSNIPGPSAKIVPEEFQPSQSLSDGLTRSRTGRIIKPPVRLNL